MKKRKIRKAPVFIIILVLLSIGYLIINKSIDNKQNKSDDEKNIKLESKKNKDKKISIVMVGDVLIHESVFKDAYLGNNKYDFTPMFEYIPSLIKDYDLKYCNQESIIGGKNLGIKGYPGFNAPDEIGDNLISTGFNMFSLANNHALDSGRSAIKYSNNYWKNKKNVIVAGTYDSEADRSNISVYEQNGIKYSFLSYTTSVNGYNLNKNESYMINMYDKDTVKRDIESIKDKVDVIIVAMHWGTEYTNTPTNSQREIANYLSSLGVNLIIGTHPHVVEPIEYINDTLVIYSLGNFISNQLVLGENPAIGLLVGVEIKIKNNKVLVDVNKKELLYSYSDHSTKFKVYPFSKLNDNILKNHKEIESKYMKIVNGN